MNNLSKPNAIKTGGIVVDDKNYFSSLLEVSYTSGIIGERVFENIRNELIAVLADKCRKRSAIGCHEPFRTAAKAVFAVFLLSQSYNNGKL